MTSLRTGHPDVDRAFALATAQAEAMVRRADGITGTERIRLASALLGAGLRAPARDLLRPAGGRPTESAELDALSRAYDAWAGDETGPRETAPRETAPTARPDPPPIAEAAAAFSRDTDSPAGVAGMLEAVVAGAWGMVPDARSGAVSIRPELPDGWRSMALSRLRIGRTVLDLDLRRLRNGLGMRIRRVAGPPLVATVEPRPPLPGPTLVDDVELAGSRVRFEVADRHDLVFHGPVR